AIIKESAHPEVNLIFGAQIDESMGDECRITVIATGFESSRVERRIKDEYPKSKPIQREQPRQQQPVERQNPTQAPQQQRPLQAPPLQQQQPPQQQAPQQRPVQPDEPRVYDESNTDIPAFLRRRNNR